MRVLLLCAAPAVAADDPESAATVLLDLGCRVVVSGFELGALDLPALATEPPDIAVFDAGDQLLLARKSREKLGQIDALARVPTLLAVTLARLPGLDFAAGFDDFVLVPIVPAEIYARLRQLDWRMGEFGSEEIVKIGELVIDLAGHEVHLGGRRLAFTHQEFELLRYLAQHRGRVYTRDHLLENVWGYSYPGSTRTVDIHIRRVRAKLGAMGGMIETVRNVGYKMRTPRPDER